MFISMNNFIYERSKFANVHESQTHMKSEHSVVPDGIEPSKLACKASTHPL